MAPLSARTVLLVLTCALGMLPGPVLAQTPSRPPAAVQLDTAVTSPLIRKIFATVAPYMARAAQDTLSTAWRIELPGSVPPWPAVRAHLHLALRARPVTPADSQFHHLAVGPVSVSGDTARSRLTWGVTRLCPDPAAGSGGSRSGYTNVEDVYMVRSTHFGLSIWGAARSDHVIHGDLFGCRAVPDH